MLGASARLLSTLLLGMLSAATAGCDRAAVVGSAAGDPSRPSGSTFVLHPSLGEDYDPAEPCSSPLSGSFVLDAGTWHVETRWLARCVGESGSDSVVTYARSGRLVQRDDTIELHPAGPVEFEDEYETGTLRSDTLTIWGHCSGSDVYVRVR